MKKSLSAVLALILALSCFAFAGCKDDSHVIRVGASPTPHAEILEQARAALAEQGYTLKIITFDDYVMPNKQLADGQLDANYFQHTPFMNSFNRTSKAKIAAAAKIHYEPFGLFGKDVSDISAIPAGATIIIPSDESNETRALLLLQQAGLIDLPAGVSAEAGITVLDIADDHGYRIQDVAPETVPAQLKNSDSGTIAVINGNYALGAGLKIADALAVESVDGDAAQTYANIIACRQGDAATEDKVQALIKALKTEAIKAYMEERYNGAVKPIF